MQLLFNLKYSFLCWIENNDLATTNVIFHWSTNTSGDRLLCKRARFGAIEENCSPVNTRKEGNRKAVKIRSKFKRYMIPLYALSDPHISSKNHSSISSNDGFRKKSLLTSRSANWAARQLPLQPVVNEDSQQVQSRHLQIVAARRSHLHLANNEQWALLLKGLLLDLNHNLQHWRNNTLISTSTSQHVSITLRSN